MTEYEATGRTLDEAVENALSFLGIKRTNALIEIIDQPTQGILGIIGGKDARVSVKTKHEPAEFFKNYLEKMLDLMNIEGRVTVIEEEDRIEAMILGKEVGTLIGRRGRSLSDLQYLLSIILRRQFSTLKKTILLDIENYRYKREKTLTQLAKNVARNVCSEGFEQALEPMSPQERRIIHIALQEYPGVTTYSDGKEPYRKVVIAPQ